MTEKRKELENIVLDSELFTREAKQIVKYKTKEEKNDFSRAMAFMLERGQSIEIIDGDIDMLEKQSLEEIMQFVQEAKIDASHRSH